MTQNSIDHISDLNRVNKHICDFFDEQGIFYSEDIGFSSYKEVIGRKAIEIPDNTPVSCKRWPIQNEKAKYISDAVHRCEKLGRTLLISDKSQNVEVLSRDFMIEGSTLPIRVGYKIGASKSKRASKKRFTTNALYVKQVHLNRIFLGTLYHLMVGRQYCMAFSESSIIEEETKGPTILETYQKHHTFLNDYKTKRELVKLSVISHFLSLYDMDNGANIVLDPWGRFDVIDFDKGFWSVIADPIKELIDPFGYRVDPKDVNNIIHLPYDKLIRHFRKGEVESLIEDTSNEIYHNLKKNKDIFHKVIGLMGTVNYYNLAAQDLYGEKDVVSYFLRRYYDLGKSRG